MTDETTRDDGPADRTLGKAIVVAGLSSVGKTSACEALQAMLPEPYLHVGIDHFFSMFPYEWRDHPRQPGPGFWVERSADETGAPMARIRYGEAGERLLTGMRAAVNALLAAGNNVILDEMPIADTVMPAWRRDLRAATVFWVHLTAPLAVVEARELGRTKGQVIGNARGHAGIDHGDAWDLTVETEGLGPREVAAAVLTAYERRG